jgi:hypothetical protein
MRQSEQVQTGKQEKDEWEQRQEAHPDGKLPLSQDDDVGDDPDRESDGQPPMELPSPPVPIHLHLL